MDLARILVATDRREHADLILGRLQGDFGDVRASTDLARAVQDFEACEPDVVVLAFDGLSGARRYCEALYAPPEPLPQHRTVILCHRDECALVVERCRDEEFDDYVPYWPQPDDEFRLPTSIRIACREMATVRAHRRPPLDLFGQTRHVEELDRILDVELDDLDGRDVGMKEALAATEREIARIVDGLSERLSDDASSDWVDVKDRAVFASEIGRFRAHQVETVRRHGATTIASMRARTRRLRDRVEPSLAGARALVEELRKLRPVVLIVEDDEFSRELVARTLDPDSWDAVFASDGASAISQLRRVRPDVILMDIRLPGIDGLSLTHQLKASPRLADIPIIMMTGDARKETLLSSLEAGAAGFVVKPFTRAVLSAKLEKLFER